MNKQIAKLAALAASPKRIIIGLMSGTSMDGLDIALCEFRGAGTDTSVKLLQFITRPYHTSFKDRLRTILFKKTADMQQITLLHAEIGSYMADLVIDTLNLWRYPLNKVDLIASHGQTVFHAPALYHQIPGVQNATLQLGDGDHIAQKTGVITISDFRQKHVAGGGEGAPLAVYGDFLLFSSPDEDRILINIGGISNLTYIPASKSSDAVISTDIGPGNTIMDQYIQLHFPGKYYDENATLASKGQVNQQLLAELMNHSFLTQAFPKTTGPELFNLDYLLTAMERAFLTDLSPEDTMATLNAFTGSAIVTGVKRIIDDRPCAVYVSGGGVHNPLLMQSVGEGLGNRLQTTSSLGIDPDAKEAVLFALLANECLVGGSIDFSARNITPSVTMGKISLPG